MPFIHRTEDGKIGLVFPDFMEGFAEEELAEDDQELVSFLNPPAPPRLVPKRIIVDRLHAAGKLEAAKAALDAQPLYTRERWNSRDSVYATDPDTVALLKAIGADPDSILAG